LKISTEPVRIGNVTGKVRFRTARRAIVLAGEDA
jgi:hypothetical protein